ncbi:RNase adapter RapZ [uncultured Nevskia sp.]|uniref:RNase adapter RapZ n=1 Tax=uncultured Nevskia sp. TaxID=228950 RepID=UPI0025ED759F|nr:RNase adapter RapZ [uncultured Nevskia sp.]
MRLVIVSGLSGAGKTVALKQYEDRGYYCIDNIPLDLLQPLLTHAVDNPGPRYRKLALGIDARCDPLEIERFPAVLDLLRGQAIDVHVLFLTADDSVILRRYNETRRRHPLSNPEVSLLDAIRLERRLLKPIADLADVPLDTTNLNLYELRAAVGARLPEPGTHGLSLLFLSFGFKNGGPEGADFVFDARVLPNPHWVPDLRALTGRDAPVVDYFKGQTLVSQFLDDTRAYLERWLPAFEAQDRPYVTVAIGCTGGQHRSVYLAERLGQAFEGRFEQVVVKHRELNA